MKKILVTGCYGQLGRAINQELAQDDRYELVNTDVDTLDICSIEDTKKLVEAVKPYAIINCAAHTNVNLCETDQDNAFRINAIGPRNLSIAAEASGAKMIHVSTDYVFDGTGTKPYREYDPVCPLGVYGSTKLEGERFVQAFSNRYMIIRTAWLYGDGKNFVKTMLGAAQKNDKVRVVRDQIGSPTSAVELAKAIHHLLPTDNYGIFHGTCEGSCSWADFTEEFYRLAGLKTVVEHITTDEYPTPAKRPAYSVLENYMLNMTTDFRFADWQDAIAVYMKTLV